MKTVPISTARAIGKKAGADRLIIIAVGDGEVTWTSWGETKKQCDALGEWAHLYADKVARHMDGWTFDPQDFDAIFEYGEG